MNRHSDLRMTSSTGLSQIPQKQSLWNKDWKMAQMQQLYRWHYRIARSQDQVSYLRYSLSVIRHIDRRMTSSKALNLIPQRQSLWNIN